MSLRFNFESGTLKQDLAQLPEQMLEGAFEALDEAADFMVIMARTRCLVDTGTLQKTIRKERGGAGKHSRVVRVRAGGYYVNPKSGRICNYAVYVELKVPFMRPAWETIQRFIRDRIREKVLQEVGT